MGKRENVIGGAVAVVAGAVAKRSRSKDASSPRQSPYTWRAVTVYAGADELQPGGRWPEPLAKLVDALEIKTSPAPGDRGTELYARLRQGASLPAEVLAEDDDPVRAIRSALRQAKQVIETGEVLQADRPGTTHPTATNAPLREAISVSGGEGRL